VRPKERDVGPYGDVAGKPGVDGLKLKAVRISARQDAAADIRENDRRAPRPPPERCLRDLTLRETGGKARLTITLTILLARRHKCRLVSPILSSSPPSEQLHGVRWGQWRRAVLWSER